MQKVNINYSLTGNEYLPTELLYGNICTYIHSKKKSFTQKYPHLANVYLYSILVYIDFSEKLKLAFYMK